LDGETLGEVEMETFSADSMTVTFQGFNTHPGFAKDKMVNAVKVAADFIGRLPEDALSPETTEGYEGYVHPYVIEGGVDRTSVKFLIRDFNTPGLGEMEAQVEKIARATVADYDKTSVEVEIQESYRNMREVLDDYPDVVEYAKEAIRRAGLEVRMLPIRGGTDGSRLCFMGLPTPNLFAGEHNFHSRLEWVSTYDMHKAVEVVIQLCQIWEQKS
jgi:tripeptide aminopeptidase